MVLGIAGYHVYKGWTKKFLEDLREHPGDWAVTAGRIGYIAKGIALVIVGFFFLVAAWQADPDKAQGLDGALKTLKDAPFGPFLLDPGGRGHRRLRRLLLRPLALRAGLSGLAG